MHWGTALPLTCCSNKAAGSLLLSVAPSTPPPRPPGEQMLVCSPHLPPPSLRSRTPPQHQEREGQGSRGNGLVLLRLDQEPGHTNGFFFFFFLLVPQLPPSETPKTSKRAKATSETVAFLETSSAIFPHAFQFFSSSSFPVLHFEKCSDTHTGP